MKAFTRSTLCLGILVCISIQGEAQINNSVYFMGGVPQANRVNPAHQPACNGYFGIPLVAPMRMEVSSNSIAYSDVIYPHPFQDSLITFLHPEGDKQAFLNKLKPQNYLTSDVRASLISLGFRTKAGFFSVDLTTRTDEAIYYSDDLARLFLTGTQEGETYNLDGTGLDLTAFDEFSVGWSYSFLHNLQIGARAKMLFGIADFTTRKSQFSLTTAQDVWNIQSDLMVSASLPFAEVVYNDDGKIEEIIVDEEIESLNLLSLPRYGFNFGNPGFSADLGINYRPIDQLLVSASVLDIGFISWKDEVHDATYEMEYDYLGLEIDPFELSDDYTFRDYIDSTFSQLSDSLSSFLEFTPGRAYSKRLNTKLYIGASYALNHYINFGILSRTDFMRNHIAQQITATANFNTGSFINFTLSYSYKDSYLNNLGAGIAFNAGPFNLYVISDNGLNVLIWPESARSANLWFGLNLVFGYKEFRDKANWDRPLVY